MRNPYADISERAEQKQSFCEPYAFEYFPKGKIELLLVGESPPLSGAYFYVPENLRRRHQGLPAKIFRGLFNADTKIDKRQCKEYLGKFQSHNFLLLDLISFPVDCFVSSVRVEFIERHIPDFIKRLSALDLSKTCKKILILPSGTHKELYTKKYETILKKITDHDFKVIKWSETETTLRKVATDVVQRSVL